MVPLPDGVCPNANLANLMLDPFFRDVLSKTQQSWREVVSIATLNGIPVPAFSASLGYYDSYRAERLPANLLQAQLELIHSLPPLAHPCGALAFRQRPFGASAAPQGFSAHTYERLDKPEGQFFHTEWPEVIG